MFTYGKETTFNIAVDNLSIYLGADWCMDDLRCYRMGYLLPLLAMFTSSTATDSYALLHFDDIDSIRVDNAIMNAVIFRYQPGLSYKTFKITIDLIFRTMIPEFKWTDKFRPSGFVSHENGQAKITMGVLECLMCEPTNELKILVIGSSSPDVVRTGMTYAPLVTWLTYAGYQGSITLYDPFEANRSCVVGNFDYKSIRAKFDYDKGDGHDYTHVFDDAWAPQITAYDTDHTYIRTKIGHIPSGKSKFVYYLEGNTMCFRAGLTAHKDSKYGLGGGEITRDGDLLTISGTSLTYGHYNVDILDDLLHGYDVKYDPTIYRHGRLSVDPNYNILNLYPRAKISLKYQGEENHGGRVVEQSHYNGREKRILYGVPDVNSSNPIGCNCRACNIAHKVTENFISYSGVSSAEIVRSIMYMTCEDMCVASPGIRITSIISTLLSHARAGSTKKVAYADVRTRYGANTSTIDRAFSILVNQQRIREGISSNVLSSEEYCDKKKIRKEIRYYNKLGTRYLRVRNGVKTVYSADTDKEITLYIDDPYLDFFPTNNTLKSIRVSASRIARLIGTRRFSEVHPKTHINDNVKGEPTLGVFRMGYDYFISTYVPNQYEQVMTDNYYILSRRKSCD